MRQSAHRRVVEVPVVAVETDGIDPRKQLAEDPAGFQTGQRRAEAVVDAAAEGEVVGRVAVEVKGVGSSKRRGSRFAAVNTNSTRAPAGIVCAPTV